MKMDFRSPLQIVGTGADLLFIKQIVHRMWH